MFFLGLRRILLAMKFFKGFPKVKDFTSSRTILVASHAWLYPQIESISWTLSLFIFLGFHSFWFSLAHVSWLFRAEFFFCPLFVWGFIWLDWPMTLSFDWFRFFSFSFQLRTHLMDSNFGGHLALDSCNHLTHPSVGGGGNPWLG